MWKSCKLCGCITMHGIYCRPCHIKKKIKIEKYPYRFGKVRIISPEYVWVEFKKKEYKNCLDFLFHEIKNYFALLIEKFSK